MKFPLTLCLIWTLAALQSTVLCVASRARGTNSFGENFVEEALYRRVDPVFAEGDGDGLLPKPPRPPSRLSLIPEVSPERVQSCMLSASDFRRTNGYVSKGQHACCLFGGESGFCGKNDQKGRVCNDAPFERLEGGSIKALPNNRSQFTTNLVNGRCCINDNKEREYEQSLFRMDCVEDQTQAEASCNAECTRLNQSCQEENKECLCNYQQVWDYVPAYKKVSGFLEARVAILANSCYLRDKSRAAFGLAAGVEVCCGSTMHPNLCAYWRRLCTLGV